MIYFVSDGQFIKVGTAINIANRMIGLMSGNPRKLEVLAVCNGGLSLERRLHRALTGRQVGEWFRITPELNALVRDLASSDPDSGEARVQAFLEENAARKRDRKVKLADFEVNFRHRLAEFSVNMLRKHGTAKYREVAEVSAETIRLHRRGKVVPTGPALMRLCAFDRELGRRLFDVGEVPETLTEKLEALRRQFEAVRREIGA